MLQQPCVLTPFRASAQSPHSWTHMVSSRCQVRRGAGAQAAWYWPPTKAAVDPDTAVERLWRLLKYIKVELNCICVCFKNYETTGMSGFIQLTSKCKLDSPDVGGIPKPVQHIYFYFYSQEGRSVRRRGGLYMAELSRRQESGGRTGQAPDGQCVMVLAIISQFSHTASSSHYMI